MFSFLHIRCTSQAPRLGAAICRANSLLRGQVRSPAKFCIVEYKISTRCCRGPVFPHLVHKATTNPGRMNVTALPPTLLTKAGTYSMYQAVPPFECHNGISVCFIRRTLWIIHRIIWCRILPLLCSRPSSCVKNIPAFGSLILLSLPHFKFYRIILSLNPGKLNDSSPHENHLLNHKGRAKFYENLSDNHYLNTDIHTECKCNIMQGSWGRIITTDWMGELSAPIKSKNQEKCLRQTSLLEMINVPYNARSFAHRAALIIGKLRWGTPRSESRSKTTQLTASRDIHRKIHQGCSVCLSKAWWFIKQGFNNSPRVITHVCGQLVKNKQRLHFSTGKRVEAPLARQYLLNSLDLAVPQLSCFINTMVIPIELWTNSRSNPTSLYLLEISHIIWTGKY